MPLAPLLALSALADVERVRVAKLIGFQLRSSGITAAGVVVTKCARQGNKRERCAQKRAHASAHTQACLQTHVHAQPHKCPYSSGITANGVVVTHTRTHITHHLHTQDQTRANRYIQIVSQGNCKCGHIAFEAAQRSACTRPAARPRPTPPAAAATPTRPLAPNTRLLYK